MSEKMAVFANEGKLFVCGCVVCVSIAQQSDHHREERQPTFHFLISTHVVQSMMVRSRLVLFSEPIPILGFWLCKGVCLFVHFIKSVVVGVGSEIRTHNQEMSLVYCVWCMVYGAWCMVHMVNKRKEINVYSLVGVHPSTFCVCN